MSKVRDGVDGIPPPPKGNSSGGKTTPSMKLQGTPVWSNSPLSSSNSSSKGRLTSSRILKSHEVASSSSSNEETDASSKEEAKGKKGRKENKRLYNTIPFNYDNLSHSNTFTLVPIGNPPPF
jgi:hypothetical protein